MKIHPLKLEIGNWKLENPESKIRNQKSKMGGETDQIN
jgi:hypothetical protein